MAYMDQELKKRLALKIKPILKKYDIKGTLSVRHYYELVLTLKSGSIDFQADSINTYQYQNHFADNTKALEFLNELIPAMNDENYDNSDIMTDYFDVGYYISVNVGRYDKPYVIQK